MVLRKFYGFHFVTNHYSSMFSHFFFSCPTIIRTAFLRYFQVVIQPVYFSLLRAPRSDRISISRDYYRAVLAQTAFSDSITLLINVFNTYGTSLSETLKLTTVRDSPSKLEQPFSQKTTIRCWIHGTFFICPVPGCSPAGKFSALRFLQICTKAKVLYINNEAESYKRGYCQCLQLIMFVINQ